MPQRVLSEDEFNAIRAAVVKAAPSGMDEAGFNRYVGPVMEHALGVAENTPAPVQGSAAGRFASNAGEMINPVAIAQGVWSAIRHPIDTATNMVTAQVDQGRQAIDLAKQGRYTEALGHAGAAALPVLGPVAAAAGEQMATGDVAGGLGKGVGLLASLEAPRAVNAGAKILRALPEGAAVAADTGAAARIADVMAPKVGANKARFGNMAADVAPKIAEDLAREGAPLSREGLHQMVQDKLGAAETALDAAHDARFKSTSTPTKPLLDALRAKRAALTSEAIDASDITPKAGVARTGDGTVSFTKTAVPLGEDVVPSPNAARVAVIDKAIEEVKKLGPLARYDPLRTMRMAYDGPAKAIYSPAMTTDYMTAQGGKLGAADVTGALRDTLSAMDPAVAKANAPYSLYRTANDVMDATAEVERTRPKVGRVIAARVMTTLIGEHAAGPAGAVAGYAIAPIIENALSRGMTTKLLTAASLKMLSNAIRKGNVGAVDTSLAQLKRLRVTAAAIQGNATSPSESQSQTTAGATP